VDVWETIAGVVVSRFVARKIDCQELRDGFSRPVLRDWVGR